MNLNELLETDREASELFSHLPLPAQKEIRRTAQHIDTVDALREHTARMIHENGPFYANCVLDGTELDPELKAHWTREHQS